MVLIHKDCLSPLERETEAEFGKELPIHYFFIYIHPLDKFRYREKISIMFPGFWRGDRMG
jgi:hypothetical protein